MMELHTWEDNSAKRVHYHLTIDSEDIIRVHRSLFVDVDRDDDELSDRLLSLALYARAIERLHAQDAAVQYNHEREERAAEQRSRGLIA